MLTYINANIHIEIHVTPSVYKQISPSYLNFISFYLGKAAFWNKILTSDKLDNGSPKLLS